MSQYLNSFFINYQNTKLNVEHPDLANLLLFLGKYSYEIFLLHGIFLIKYNPFIRGPGKFALVMGFSLLLFFTKTFAECPGDECMPYRGGYKGERSVPLIRLGPCG